MRLRKQQRLALVLLALLLVGGATGLVLAALQDKVAFFVTPSDVADAAGSSPGKRFRLGGLVVEGSIQREADGTVRFAVTDTAQQVEVVYKGLLPDLFRDGQGVVTQGALRADGTFEAAEVLAKHDENYMPKEVADALKQAGYWKRAAQARGRDAMIAELGHYALVLALGLALVQGDAAAVGRRPRATPTLIGVAEPAACAQFLFVTLAFAALMHAYVDLRLLGRERRRELALAEAAALQDQRHLGQPRGLAGPLGLDPGAVRRRRGRCSAATCRRRFRARVLAVQALIGVGFLAFMLFTSNPFLRLDPAPPDGQRPQPDPAGPRPRLPPADALPRLCRLLDRLLASPSRR